MKSFMGKNTSDEKRKSIARLNRYLFEHIILNDISWKEFALPIVVSLVYGGS